MDHAGRIVVPKSLRDQLGFSAGVPLRAVVRDGHLEIEPAPIRTKLVEHDGVFVITPIAGEPVLTQDDVRAILDSVRR